MHRAIPQHEKGRQLASVHRRETGTGRGLIMDNRKLMLLVKLKLLFRRARQELDMERYVKDPAYAALVLARAAESGNEEMIGTALALMAMDERKETPKQEESGTDEKYFRSLR
jgi:hypothetical protein